MGFIGPLLWDLHYKKVVKHFACGNICAYACLVVVVAEERILYAVYADVIDSSKKGDSKLYGRHIYINISRTTQRLRFFPEETDFERQANPQMKLDLLTGPFTLPAFWAGSITGTAKSSKLQLASLQFKSPHPQCNFFWLFSPVDNLPLPCVTKKKRQFPAVVLTKTGQFSVLPKKLDTPPEYSCWSNTHHI
ncbi:uncharacterized protein LOC131801122 [Musca domestica]|uniref:Uncharacterized protein LOC131801122 n=1 Tax=Musca domestica TaxID=7370 RepID=A0ABM3UNW4_MUSDO|nr:uncharacterized protein LOC131801122 [Musca domestica]